MDECDFPCRQFSVRSQRDLAIVRNRLSFASQWRTSPSLYLVGSACRTTANWGIWEVVVGWCGGGEGGAGGGVTLASASHTPPIQTTFTGRALGRTSSSRAGTRKPRALSSSPRRPLYQYLIKSRGNEGRGPFTLD